MKKWRVRQYVADSEDEEESSTGSWSAHGAEDGLRVAESEEIGTQREAQDDDISRRTSDQIEAVASSLPNVTVSEQEIVVENAGGKEHGQEHEAREQLKTQDDAAQLPFEPQQNVQSSASPGLFGTPMDLDQVTPLSSPLSSLSHSPHVGPAETSNPADTSGFRDIEDFLSLPSSPPEAVIHPRSPRVEITAPPLGSIELGSFAPRRNFRERKAIQLHPYAILDGKYQNEMRAAGLVPTRVVRNSPPRGTHAKAGNKDDDSGTDSQATYTGAEISRSSQLQESRSDTPDENSASRIRSAESSPVARLNLDDNDELPALDTLLNHKPKKTAVYVGAKRRKLLQSQHVEQPRSPALHIHTDMPDELPSPNSSLELPKGPAAIVFRVPRLLSPQKPPTPATSSSNNVRGRRKTAPTPDSDASPVNRSVRKHVRISSNQDVRAEDVFSVSSSTSPPPSRSPSPTPSPPPASRDEMRHVQRRIKGVLPASWLRFDVNNQKPSKPKLAPRLQERDDEVEEHRGVARRRLGPSTSGALPGPFLISSGDESDDEPAILPPAPVSQQQRGNNALERLFTFDEDPGEIMEDDTIDFMMPAIPRGQRALTRRDGKRQTKLTDALGAAREPRTVRSSHRNPVKRPQPGVQTYKQARFRAPKLSILDNSPKSPLESASVPAFLKVARRQARQMRDKGRHSPTKKTFRLQTKDDTAEIQSVLADWRQGKIQKKERQPDRNPGARQPLQPRDANASLAGPLSQFKRSYVRVQVRPGSTKRSSTQSTSKASTRPGNDRSRQLPQPRSRKIVWAQHLQNGQLETQVDEMPSQHDRSRFSRGLELAGAVPTFLQSLQTETRLLDIPHVQPREPDRAQPIQNLSTEVREEASMSAIKKPRKPRKRAAQRVDVETVQFRQPEEVLLPPRHRSASLEMTTNGVAGPVLRDLQPWGVPYSVDFDVLPFFPGTFFHSTTLLGSGRFRAAMEITSRDLSVNIGAHRAEIDGSDLPWGHWNEESAGAVKKVTSELALELAEIALAGSIGHAGNENHTRDALGIACLFIEGMIEGNSRWLSFADAVDSRDFGNVLLDSIDNMLQCLGSGDLAEPHPSQPSSSSRHSHLRFHTRVATLAAQVFLVLRHYGDVSLESRDRCVQVISRCLNAVADHIVEGGMEEVRSFYAQMQAFSEREKGMTNDHMLIEAIATHVHVCDVLELPNSTFWDVLNTRLLSRTSSATKLGALEHVWLTTFTMLPIFEIDLEGVLKSGQRFAKPYPNWAAVTSLVSRVAFLYEATATVQASTINDYFRALLARCHCLIKSWGWCRCETVVSAFFDFFAKRQYRSLHNERVQGSAQFLEELHKPQSIIIDRNENAFHLFLKLVATGIAAMRKNYDNKKLRSFIWRWIPNHSRTFSKDQDLREEDLDAIRNQHDLLSTIYWASPPGFRPRIDLIQGLVDQTASHLEVCRINIKAWSNLTSFQLSTNESLEAIEPFSAWLRDLLDQNTSQFKLARPELEAQHEQAKSDGVAILSSSRLEAMIAKNQNGILAALSDIVLGCRTAIDRASTLDAAWALLRNSHLGSIFAIFAAKHHRSNGLMTDVVQVLDSMLDKVDAQKPTLESQTTEESQDYGEWPEEEDLSSDDSPLTSSITFCIDHAWMLMSNVFGSEHAPEDSLMAKLVEYWTKLIAISTRRKAASLESFLTDYGRHSWNQLRDTSQRRKYTPYFFSCLLTQNSSLAREPRETVLSVWLSSLVERESQLKYQHLLTSSLLDAAKDDALLQNLPFIASAPDSPFQISVMELRERRLLLLSSILSNMHDIFQAHLHDDLNSLRAVRAEYSNLLQRMMLQMRRNYEELGQGESASGAYVSFVQTVVEFMQQYTADICPIDKFFTDSAAFPLPSNDPTYLVGRLRGYNSKLGDPKAVKQLCMFVQNVSERAAVDGEQAYLSSQLMKALDSSGRSSHAQSVTLRSVMTEVIFPAYIENSFEHPAAWIYARPTLAVCKSICKNAIFELSATESASVASIIRLLESTLSSLVTAVVQLEFALERFNDVRVVLTLAMVFQVATACLPTVDYIMRRNNLGSQAADLVGYLRDFTLFTGQMLLGRNDAISPTNIASAIVLDTTTANLKEYCSQRLKEELRERWRCEDGLYSVRRGTNWREVHVEMGAFNDEKAELICSIEEFHAVLSRTQIL